LADAALVDPVVDVPADEELFDSDEPFESDGPFESEPEPEDDSAVVAASFFPFAFPPPLRESVR
jgi:hypothetical protein